MSPGIWSTAIAFALAAADGDAGGVLACEEHNNRLVITSDDRPVMWYVFGDGRILRPYFAHVRAPSGVQVTRQHPPRQGVDATDHDTMHPGIWLAFGDINGHDFWRNKGHIEHVRFIVSPSADAERLTSGGTRGGSKCSNSSSGRAWMAASCISPRAFAT
jgi:hypothetical protein